MEGIAKNTYYLQFKAKIGRKLEAIAKSFTDSYMNRNRKLIIGSDSLSITDFHIPTRLDRFGPYWKQDADAL